MQNFRFLYRKNLINSYLLWFSFGTADERKNKKWRWVRKLEEEFRTRGCNCCWIHLQWKKWRWVKLWCGIQNFTVFGAGTAGSIVFRYSAMRPLFRQIRLRCLFFPPGAGVVGNPSYLLLDWLCWILFCLAYSLVTWFLLFRHESRTFQRETDSHLASQLVLHYLTVMPAVGFFLEKKGRRAALLEKTEPGLLCCPSSEPTIHGRALAEKCSTGWSRRLHIPWSVDSAWHGSHLTHRLSRRLIRSKASPPDSRAWLDLLLHSVSSLSSHTVSWTSLSWLEWSLWSLPPSGPDYPCRWIPWRESAATCDNPKVSRQKMIAWPADLRCFSDSAPKPTPIKWYLSLALCSTHQYHLASRDHIPWANTMEKLRA